MRAMGFDRYGEADVTCLIEGPIPGPREGDVSIRVDYVRVKPSLKALAPTQSEPPFAIAQGLLLVVFALLGVAAVKRFRIEPMPLAAAASG